MPTEVDIIGNEPFSLVVVDTSPHLTDKFLMNYLNRFTLYDYSALNGMIQYALIHAGKITKTRVGLRRLAGDAGGRGVGFYGCNASYDLEGADVDFTGGTFHAALVESGRAIVAASSNRQTAF